MRSYFQREDDQINGVGKGLMRLWDEESVVAARSEVFLSVDVHPGTYMLLFDDNDQSGDWLPQNGSQ